MKTSTAPAALAISALLAASFPAYADPDKKLTPNCCDTKPAKKNGVKVAVAACSGSSSCRVCSNCSSCKHCKGDGSCGACRPGADPLSLRAASTGRSGLPPGFGATPAERGGGYQSAYGNHPYLDRTPAKRPVPIPVKMFPGLVVGVHDGDTMTVQKLDKKLVKVRLFGIDAPEPSQPFFKSSRDSLSALALQKSVRVYPQARDGAGLLYAVMEVSAPIVAASPSPGPVSVSMNIIQATPTPSPSPYPWKHLNREQVRTGMAWWRREHAPDNTTLKILHEVAKENRMGLWQDAAPVPPWK